MIARLVTLVALLFILHIGMKSLSGGQGLLDFRSDEERLEETRQQGADAAQETIIRSRLGIRRETGDAP